MDRETLEVDILFVGAGPSNLAAALHLSQLLQAKNLPIPQIAIVEKASEVGFHQMSGAVLNPTPLKELLPDYLQQGCPLESEITSEAIYYLTRTKSFRSPIIPPQMNNHGNYVISLSKFTRWLGEQVAAAGINIFTGFPARDVLYEGDRVVGVSTGDKGIDSKGDKKENFEPGVNIRAKCTVFGEGVRGFLTKSLMPRLGLDRGKHSQTFETGVKEIWHCPPGRVVPGMVIHTAGYPLDRNTVGGSFLYGMKDDHLVVGLVVSLNYSDPFLEPYRELQNLKAHPLVSRLIEGGKPVAYGAKAIASGGYYSIPRLTFDGGMIVGESGALLDMSSLKGIHVGMRSGMLAAKKLAGILAEGADFTAERLNAYEDSLYASDVGRALYRSRNFHQALSKGMPTALLHLAAQQITGGRGLIDPMPTKLDRRHYQTVKEAHGRSDALIPTFEKRMSDVDKLTSVYNAGTIHEENQPCHLKIHNTSVCYDTCAETYRSPCTRFCPASVYEMLSEGGNLRLQLNFTNCVHCQTCDIKCPEDNILWTPPEGGGGPKYSIL